MDDADDPKPWQVVSREYVLQEPPWMVLRRDHFRLPTGSEIERYWIQEFPPWVNVVAVTPAQEILLIRQYRPGLGAVHYELPAGSTDPGEEGAAGMEQAARRELLEETGYGGGTWSPLMRLSANPALQSNLTHTFLALDVEPIADPKTEATEDLRLHILPADQVRQLVDDGAFAQALHVAPLLQYFLRFR